jgi:hypothetical protein
MSRTFQEGIKNVSVRIYSVTSKKYKKEVLERIENKISYQI